ncbi:sensor domain-containing diguanylate cyclase [Pseudomonas sp. GOM6]|uniref:sensor domain-containing diguanylate cyclase n=1 Tax=Pseudomonas sp. GOM6 TaxID=3036944 RepID=UPI002409CE4F|nr:sensor domain-containing diguanylate cyclase [Pseudomonas sp. GOM6]MDG1581789.1 sensor domain-containing diguanylate cyclase [Pseudomonas sp. GOM6]
MNDPFQADSAVYKTLLESTKAIPWKIDWASMTFAYIGPQIEPLLGWTQQSWISANDWAERIHEEDRERVVNFCIAQSQSGIDHEADYRALTADGRYVWIRDVVHVLRNAAGETEALVGFMFDISERKKTEEQLLALQKQLEEYSYKDGLTGINNRRMFDSVLDVEWASAQRSRRPLSLILLDIDFFKQFNDHYGHIQGDDCLRRVAEALEAAAVRPRDCVARFGGEEFVLVLPETDAESAKQIAERCRKLVGHLRIPHEQSKVAQLLTLSLGVGTIIPEAHDSPLDFIEAVDRLLYQAKQQGRDRLLQGHCSTGEEGACQA